MVTAVETKEKVDQKVDLITLEEFGGMIGIPIKVHPWQESVPRECRKKNPEIQNGAIVVWEGKCGYGGHTHAQVIEVKIVAHRAMLITVRITEQGPSQFLLGVDGAAPYVVQVPLRAQTVDGALDWLMPKLVREAIAQGLDVKRQGDWYFIPRDKPPSIHERGDRIYRATGIVSTNKLYRGAHLIFNGTETRHRASMVVYQVMAGTNGPAPLVKGKVTGPDHEPLYLDKWHLGVRNRSHPWRNTDGQRRRFDD